jgi:hypothetical protein
MPYVLDLITTFTATRLSPPFMLKNRQTKSLDVNSLIELIKNPKLIHFYMSFLFLKNRPVL